MSYYNAKERDRYLRSLGLHPEDYGGEKTGNKPDKKSDAGCFLTSACVEARGLPDDCEELTILRNYGDTYLRNMSGGDEEVLQYYRIAPTIFEHIKARNDSAEIWGKVYREMVLPCVEMIKAEKMAEAFMLYKSYTIQLAEF